MTQITVPKKVALSGGIGSGKTVFTKVFAALGVPIYNSDIRAKQLMQSSEIIRKQLIAVFGEAVYENNELQKKTLAQYIFNNNELRQKVNAIVHPVVIDDYNAWSTQQNAVYTIMETALLFENDLYKNFDTTIYIQSPIELRIARVMQRDNCTRAEVEKRIKMQIDDTICVQKADYVVENNNFALSQILAVHNSIQNNFIAEN